MIQLYQKVIHLKVLRFFLDHPYEEFHLRGLSRDLNMDVMTLKRKLAVLIDDGLILKREDRGFHLFRANVEDIRFLQVKKSYNIFLLVDSGIVGDLMEADPSISSIILYGSMSKGTDSPESDIDILMISTKKISKDAPLKKLKGRVFNIVTVTPSEWSLIYQKNKPFYDEVVVHGITLHGRKPVV